MEVPAGWQEEGKVCPPYFCFNSNGASNGSIILTVQHLLLGTLDEIQGHIREIMNIMWYYVTSVVFTLTNGCAFPLKCF